LGAREQRGEGGAAAQAEVQEPGPLDRGLRLEQRERLTRRGGGDPLADDARDLLGDCPRRLPERLRERQGACPREVAELSARRYLESDPRLWRADPGKRRRDRGSQFVAKLLQH
jgi:hypothetical protein